MGPEVARADAEGMFTYADPKACPGCRSALPSTVVCCPACHLVLSGAGPARVFQALQQVDLLVADLYGDASRATSPATPSPAPGAAVPPSRARATLSAASIPQILLGLGALCLVVAAVVFLAVAWAALGIDGRTGVLVASTGVAAAVARVLARRRLAVGTEAFAAVALGLVALDLGGAWRAGWLGDLAEATFLVLAGTTVAVLAATVARAGVRSSLGRLVSTEVIAVVAVATAAAGAFLSVDASAVLGSIGALAVCAGGAAVAHVLGLRVMLLGASGCAATSWLLLVGLGIPDADELTVARLWLELAAYPLLVAAAVAALVAVPRGIPQHGRVVAASLAVLLGAFVLTAPGLDESPTRVALVELAVVAAAAVASRWLRPGWRWVCAAPSVIAAVGLTAGVVRLGVTAVEALVADELWTRGALDRLAAPDVPWTWPLLLPAGVAGAAACVATVLHCAGRGPRRAAVPGLAAVLVACGLVLPLYGAPLAVAVLAWLVVAALLVAGGLVLERAELGVVVATVVLLALATAAANEWTTLLVLAVVTGAAVAGERLLPARSVLPELAVLVAPVTAAAALWTVGELGGVGLAVRALVVLVVLGVVVVLAPRVEREVAAAVAGCAAVAGALLVPGQLDLSWLAIHLSVAGVAATVSSLVNADRRHLAWVGLGLLALAQWIRLYELGVETVEAYTLPLATVLLVAGVVAVRRGAGPSLRLLAPGLGLALVPTLLEVLVDPVGVRTVLLGLACLVLVAVGVAAGWAAPLLAGASVGAVVVLRQGTWAEVLPQWVLIGLVGIALTAVGITWEQRLAELRRVSSYVRALR